MTKIFMTHALQTTRNLALVISAALACGAAFAGKPEWAGGGKHDKEAKHEKKEHGHKERGHKEHDRKDHERKEHSEAKESKHDDVKVGAYFGDQQRVVVQNYYGNHYKNGRCPPGLAKKNNGCMPPGQAKKYTLGQPLARDVVFYSVPQVVVTQLGAPPVGYRYGRVASDILLIANGSNMVVDAIRDIVKP